MPTPESARLFLSGLADRVRKLKKTIAFADGDDPRVQEAAARLARESVVRPVLIGRRAAIDGVQFIDPANSPLVDKYAGVYHQQQRSSGVTRVEAAEAARQPLCFASLMVAAGDADGSIGGAANTVAETLRAALDCVGPDPRARLVCGVSILALADRSIGHNGIMAFADCAVAADPTPVQLADIAIAAADATRSLIGAEPAVALLSFATKGSREHRKVDQVVEALRIVQARAPDLNVDGELQADAAIAAGRNTLIFPDLASADIACKLLERVGGAAAIGPLFLGLARPANAVSSGCSAEDVYHAAILTAAQSERE